MGAIKFFTTTDLVSEDEVQGHIAIPWKCFKRVLTQSPLYTYGSTAEARKLCELLSHANPLVDFLRGDGQLYVAGSAARMALTGIPALCRDLDLILAIPNDSLRRAEDITRECVFNPNPVQYTDSEGKLEAVTADNCLFVGNRSCSSWRNKSDLKQYLVERRGIVCGYGGFIPQQSGFDEGIDRLAFYPIDRSQKRRDVLTQYTIDTVFVRGHQFRKATRR